MRTWLCRLIWETMIIYVDQIIAVAHLFKACSDQIFVSNRKTLCFLLNIIFIVRRGVQSLTWKNSPIWRANSHPKSHYLSPSKLSDPPKVKFPFHSHLEYILQKVFNLTGVKLTIARLSLVGIYLYQSTNRFINSHLFMHSHKGGLTICSNHPMRMYKQTKVLQLKLHLEKVADKIYAKSWNTN